MTTTELIGGYLRTRFAAGAGGGHWHDFWHGDLGESLLSRGLSIALLLIGAVLAARFITWVAGRVSRRIDAGFQESDALVRSESAKHRQAVASVISYVAIALLGVMVVVEITDILKVPVSSLVAPAAVIGAAVGFGAQRIVQDLLAGFFIITEKQYGFGDLVELTLGTSGEAMGTVEDVTLRVTKLRTADGELYTISNGQIFKTLNLSNQWARAVIDIPVPSTADLSVVNDVLHHVCEAAPLDPQLRDLLLDKPQVMGVESLEVDTVNLRMVARTLPGKQFEAGRQLRMLVVAALARAGIHSAVDNPPLADSADEATVVGGVGRSATAGDSERDTQGSASR
jgi:small-conductance mechanosensitive channel